MTTSPGEKQTALLAGARPFQPGRPIIHALPALEQQAGTAQV